MTNYGQTEYIIVRKLEERDAESFLKFMAERGTAEDYTVEDIKNVLMHRDEQGHMQCVITSADGSIVYGFCGIFHPPIQVPQIHIGFFEKYKNDEYERQVKTIMESLKR